MKRILVTGANGQVGVEMTAALRDKYGADNIVAADVNPKPHQALKASGRYVVLDVCDGPALKHVVEDYDCESIFHLAALLSAVAETKLQTAWQINVNGLLNVLEAAREFGCSVFFPSSIAAFGPDTPADDTPQVTIQRPTTLYGISKVSGELLCDYYFRHFGVDTRGLRYPGLISSKALPGGGTTDYAVHIFYAALSCGRYPCFLRPDTRLDMMYMPDAIRAALELMDADADRLQHRNAYNLTATSFTPEELAAEIRRHIPGFAIDYAVDPLRQSIADSWPRHVNDSAAHSEWGWQAEFDLPALVEDMLTQIELKTTHK